VTVPVHERLGYRVLAPDRIPGYAAIPHYAFTAQSTIMSLHCHRDRSSVQLLGRIMAGTEKRSRSNKETDDGGRGYAVETRCTRVRALLTPPIQAPGLRAPCGHADLFGARNIEQARILAVEPPKRIRRREALGCCAWHLTPDQGESQVEAEARAPRFSEGASHKIAFPPSQRLSEWIQRNGYSNRDSA